MHLKAALSRVVRLHRQPIALGTPELLRRGVNHCSPKYCYCFPELHAVRYRLVCFEFPQCVELPAVAWDTRKPLTARRLFLSGLFVYRKLVPVLARLFRLLFGLVGTEFLRMDAITVLVVLAHGLEGRLIRTLHAATTKAGMDAPTCLLPLLWLMYPFQRLSDLAHMVSRLPNQFL